MYQVYYNQLLLQFKLKVLIIFVNRIKVSYRKYYQILQQNTNCTLYIIYKKYNNICPLVQRSNTNKIKMQDVNVPVCPRCQYHFPADHNLHTFLNHVRQCTGQPQQPGNYNQNHNKKKKGVQITANKEQFYYQKIPIIVGMPTKFKWQKKRKNVLDYNKITGLTSKQVIDKGLNFQQKQAWLRNKLEATRISWTQGADYMNIDKQNILMTSLNQSKNVNMLKQVKINFNKQKVNDAGGLLRQWIYMIIKEIFNMNTGIFYIANTQDIMYKLKWDQVIDEIFSKQLLCMLGIILAKAIFERIPINSYLDRTILRQITGNQVKIEDIYGYDQQLYRNWNLLLNTPNAQQLDTYFTLMSHTGQTLKQIQILPDGKQTIVTDDNKHLYVELWYGHYYIVSIQMLVCNNVYRSVNAIRQGIERVFPCNYLSVFEPYEIQMLLYGVPFIDIQQWHDNTEYRQPYSAKHQVIKWFWKLMQTFDQEQLSRILHFCTGSSRTPIHGFNKLQSNRGNYSKFLIVSIKYEKKNPFPKGYTCFNRLQLPMYTNYELLSNYLTAISKNELDGIFGLD